MPGTTRRSSSEPAVRVERLTDGGMVLGIFPDIHYEQAALALAAGDRLLFYTDGITEARNPAGDEYKKTSSPRSRPRRARCRSKR